MMASMANIKNKTVKSDEIARFSALAQDWWDANGPMRPLHRLNPARLDYIKRMVTAHFRKPALSGLTILDVGCGAGLVSEPLAAEGAGVTGIDASDALIGAARLHAKNAKAKPDYRATTLETVVETGEKFDVVLALEVIEHTADPDAFVKLCAGAVTKGGLVIFSTLNRTPKSFLLGIVAAEYVLGWVPAGTHEWKSFLKPSELVAKLHAAKLMEKDICGLSYNPVLNHFSLGQRDVGVNYFLTATTA